METTQLLIDLSANSGRLTLDKEEMTTSPTTRETTARLSYFSYLALNGSAARAPPPSLQTLQSCVHLLLKLIFNAAASTSTSPN